jgi:uncharacterized Tic20 family protein
LDAAGTETGSGGREWMEHDAQGPGDDTPLEPGPAVPGAADGPPSGPPTGSGPPATRPQLTDPEARTFAMLAHLSAFSGFVIPFGHILGPLLIWLIKREEHPLVDDQGREALNFQLSMSLYYIVGLILILALIGFVILPLLVAFSIVVTIIGTIRANGGERYRYPLCIRFIK